ncbi:hypothetical protein AXX17_AT5G02070 [Arabidopsis thaliana]|uniref:Uncharacterized protein n=1 Tax=Arabidopsis thaliana TaxID=3702 RepID=A0A178UMV8_ARATH|nr:hypothetical protein AXX17_AT5G02070 [Arabidopsis thaliana]
MVLKMLEKLQNVQNLTIGEVFLQICLAILAFSKAYRELTTMLQSHSRLWLMDKFSSFRCCFSIHYLSLYIFC